MATGHIMSFSPVLSQDIGDSHRDWRGPRGRSLPTYLVPGFGRGCSISSVLW